MGWNRGWLTALAGTGINLTLGLLYAWSVFKGPVKESLQISEFEASLPYAVAIAFLSMMSVPAGRLQDRLGPKLIVTIGSVLASVGLILSYFATSVSLLTLTFGVLFGAGSSLAYSSVTPAAVKWFPPALKGLVIGVVVSGLGLAPVYISPLSKLLLAEYGVQTSFLILGIAFLGVTLVLSRLVDTPPAGYVLPVTGGKAVAAGPKAQDYDWRDMLRTKPFWLLWLTYAAGATGGLMVIGHLATYAKSVGVDGGFFLVALLAIFNACGRIAAGVVSDRIGRIRTLMIVFVLHSLALLATPYLKGMLLLSVATAVLGLFYGSYLALFPSITYEYYGTRHGGVNYGLLFTAWGVGGVFGAPLAGYVKDATGSYTLAFLIASGLVLLAAGLTFLVKPPAAASRLLQKAG